MRAVLDACVLVPPVLREILLAVAARALIEPLWSDRILGEWAHASRKFGAEAETAALLRIAQLRRDFPRACRPPFPGLEGRLHLPDPNDNHVLATAIGGGADAIVTVNTRDFPRGTLAEDQIARRDPDGLLWELWSFHPSAVAAALEEVRAEASRRDGAEVPLAALLKRSRLNRLGRALRAGG